MKNSKIVSLCPANEWRGAFFHNGEVHTKPVACWVVVNGKIEGVFSECFGSGFNIEIGTTANFLGYLGPGENIPDYWRSMAKAMAEAKAERKDDDKLFLSGEDNTPAWICDRYAKGDPVSVIVSQTGLSVEEVFKSMGKLPEQYEEAQKSREKCLQGKE